MSPYRGLNGHLQGFVSWSVYSPGYQFLTFDRNPVKYWPKWAQLLDSEIEPLFEICRGSRGGAEENSSRKGWPPL